MIAALDGDGAAYGELLAILSGYLRGHFRRRLGGGAADVEDLVQETVLAIHLKRAVYDRAQPFTPWVYAIARYKLLDHYRRVGSRHAVPIEDAGDLFAVENPEEGAVRRDIEKLLGKLPARQRALMAVHLKRGVYDPAAPFTPWVYAIARYKLLDHYRRVGSRRAVPLEDAGELFAVENPEEGAVRRDIEGLLGRLPERQRALVADVKLTGLSMQEAAARRGMSVTAVKVAVHRAMKRLEKEVRDEDR